MGNLSNLYISQSYQSLIHLGSDNTASSTLVGLQDGLGNSIGISVNTSGSLSISGSFTASLANGYAWVGDGNNRTSLVPTSSFGSVTSAITGSSLITASFSGNTLTFTKGNNTTFGVVIPDVSGSGPTDISALNAFTASQYTINSAIGASTSSLNSFTSSVDTKFIAVGSSTASLNSFTSSQNTKNSTLATYTASIDTKFSTIGSQSGSWDNTNLNAFSASVNTKFTAVGSSTSSLNAFTSSQNTKNSTLATYTGSNDTKWNTLGSLSGSLVNNIYATANPLEFNYSSANGNVTSVTLVASPGSTIDTGSFATTGSNSFNGDQTITGSLIVNYDTNSLPQLVIDKNTYEVTLRKIQGTQPMLIENSGTSNIQINTTIFDDSYKVLVNNNEFYYDGGTFLNQLQKTQINGKLIVNGPITASGIISSSAEVYGTYFQGDSVYVKNLIYPTAGFGQISNGGNASSSMDIFVGGNSSLLRILSANQIQIGDSAPNNKGVRLTGSLDILNNLTASLANGFTFVGNGSGRTIAVATSSFVSTPTDISALNAFTSSQNTKNSTLATYTASVDTKFSTIGTQSGSWDNTALNAFSASQITKDSTLATYTASVDQKFSNIGSQSGSWDNTNINAFTQSVDTKFTAVGVSTASLNSFTSSQDTKNSTLGTYTASVDTKFSTLGSQSGSWITESETGSFARTNVDNNFSVNQTFTNITAVSASFTYVQTLYETSSVIYSSGSNQFGDELSDIQTLSGSVKIQGNLTINGTPVQTSSVDISALNAFTQSQETKNSTLGSYTASVDTKFVAVGSSTASLNSFTQSQDTKNSTLASYTASVDTKFSTIGTQSGSWDNTSLNSFTQSVDTKFTAVGSSTASLNAYTQSNDTKWNTLGGQTGSYVTSAITGSSLVTASFSGNTLTFTKGDSSTFGVIIPDVSGSTGNFATTGSNTFVGNQTITGSLFVSGNINMVNGADIVTHHVRAEGSNGLELQTSNGTIIVQMGAGGGTQAAFVGAVTANSVSASTITGIGNVTTYSSSVDSRLVAEEASSSLFATKFATIGTQSGSWGGGGTDTGSLMVTGSVVGNVLTFTKGDASQFSLTVATGSGGGGSTDTGSLLVTASFDTSTRNITFTKGDATGFNISGFATTGSNTGNNRFVGEQQITSSLNALTILGYGKRLNFGDNSQQADTARLFLVESDGNNQGTTLQFTGANTGVVFSINDTATPSTGSTPVSFENTSRSGSILFLNSGNTGNITFQNNTGSINLRAGSSISISGSSTTIQDVNFIPFSQSLNSRILAVTGSSLITGSVSGNVLTFTKGDASTFTLTVATGSGGGSTIDTGSFATTGSNVFTGSQTYADSGSNSMTLHSQSGSLVYTNGNIDNFFNVSSSLGLNPNGRLGGNLLFKNAINQSGSLVISGSGNIISGLPTVTTGFRGQLSAGNIVSALPSVSASMAFPLNINSNILQSGLTFRGPASSSAYNISTNYFGGGVTLGSSAANNFEKAVAGVTLNNNVINAAVSAVANTTNLNAAFSIINSNINQALTINATSSSVQIANANMGGASATINSRAFHTGSNNYTVIASTLTSGQTTTINSDGASATNVTPGVVASLIGGSQSAIQLGSVGVTSDSNQLRNSIVFGLQLQVTGSNSVAASTAQGSAFLGRQNATDAGRNDSSRVVLAVGTGTNTTTGRKTGFLIDSGSNTFVEGTLNVSGSTTLSGSLYIQSGSTLPAATGSSVLTWNSATGQVSQSPIATLISSSFSVGAFNSTITQSGSAAVSQSMTFNNTDISNGITLNGGGTQLTIANSGTYNIQFSAQLLADTGADTIWIWLKKNGTNVSNTATKLVLANNEANVAAWNFVVPAVANDYFELVWQNNGGHTKLLTETASGNYPAIPSVIVTVTQVE